ncbi:DUF421 domain-containing protein [Cohnella lupini]|uniref:Uncharacterized membrane protein YcaP (DUF421 family) n=1 Tax=Cohnella lupini TaxID=1294267 RepID=A0A3D9IQT7_9BACL|nr:DUF421 domain-containing protein [Cohnella lupini]RED64143.1 uncharacterized membrane protein YcaP (DUF421 family) [Cohnella lupini]
MELTAILLRTTFMYFFIFMILRLMGKREIGKLSVFDLVISIMIAEIAVIVIEATDKSMVVAIAPIVLLFIIQIGLAYFTMKNRKLRMWFDGKPSVLIRDGHLNRDEMKKQRYNLDDLMQQLRESQVTEVKEVELAVLESTGKLSVITKDSGDKNDSESESGDKSEQYEKTDRAPQIRYELLPMALILDGQVQDDNLEKLGKTRFWLKSELRNFEVDQFKQVFFCTIDHRGKLYVDKK